MLTWIKNRTLQLDNKSKGGSGETLESFLDEDLTSTGKLYGTSPTAKEIYNWVSYENTKRKRASPFRKCLIWTTVWMCLGCLIALIYFLWPRMPEFKVSSIAYGNGDPLDQPLESHVELLKKMESNLPPNYEAPLSFFGVTLNVGVIVYSYNYLSIPINDIILTVFSSNGLSLGGGHLKDPIDLNPRASNKFNIPINLLLADFVNNIKILELLKESCSPDPELRTPLTFNYNAVIHLDLLDKLGISPPSIKRSFDLDCPWDISDGLSRGLNLLGVNSNNNKDNISNGNNNNENNSPIEETILNNNSTIDNSNSTVKRRSYKRYKHNPNLKKHSIPLKS